MSLVLVNNLTQFNHDVLNPEIFKLDINIEATLELAHDPGSLDSPGYITLADCADARVVVCWIKYFSLLLDSHITKHLIKLVVILHVREFMVFDELECEHFVHILGHFIVNIVPLVYS